MATITGTNGNDTLTGTNGNDTISGGNGNDTLSGGAGNDSLSGGNGNDILSGGEGNDTLSGDGGDDTLSGGSGDDTLSGGAGNDILMDGAGSDILKGDGGNDTAIYTMALNLSQNSNILDQFDGGSGTDKLVIDLVGTSIPSGFSSLQAYAQAIQNYFNSHVDSGTVDFRAMGLGHFALVAKNFESIELKYTINGTGNNDQITGTLGDDVINTDAGNDTITINPDAGHDVIDGGADTDTLQVNGNNVGIDTDTGGFDVQNGTGQADVQNVEEVHVSPTAAGDVNVGLDLDNSGTSLDRLSVDAPDAGESTRLDLAANDSMSLTYQGGGVSVTDTSSLATVDTSGFNTFRLGDGQQNITMNDTIDSTIVLAGTAAGNTVDIAFGFNSEGTLSLDAEAGAQADTVTVDIGPSSSPGARDVELDMRSHQVTRLDNSSALEYGQTVGAVGLFSIINNINLNSSLEVFHTLNAELDLDVESGGTTITDQGTGDIVLAQGFSNYSVGDGDIFFNLNTAGNYTLKFNGDAVSGNTATVSLGMDASGTVQLDAEAGAQVDSVTVDIGPSSSPTARDVEVDMTQHQVTRLDNDTLIDYTLLTTQISSLNLALVNHINLNSVMNIIHTDNAGLQVDIGSSGTQVTDQGTNEQFTAQNFFNYSINSNGNLFANIAAAGDYNLTLNGASGSDATVNVDAAADGNILLNGSAALDTLTVNFQESNQEILFDLANRQVTQLHNSTLVEYALAIGFLVVLGNASTASVATLSDSFTMDLFNNIITNNNTGDFAIIDGFQNALGGLNNDTLISDNQDNLFAGFAGDDLFGFLPNSGHDLIADFSNIDNDRIDVSAYGITSAAGFAAVGQVGADTVIDIDGINSITLNNFNFADLDLVNDFVYSAAIPLFTANDDTVVMGAVNPGNFVGDLFDALGGNDVVTLPDLENAQWSGVYIPASTIFHGGNGNDIIIEGNQSDLVLGEAGNDTFVKNAINNNGSLNNFSGGADSDTVQLDYKGSTPYSVLDSFAQSWTAALDGGGTIDFNNPAPSFSGLSTELFASSIDVIEVKGISEVGLGDAHFSFIVGSNADNVINGRDEVNPFDLDSKIDARDGADTIYDGTANTIITGGSGADTFVFAQNNGQDTITDFTSHSDVMDVTAFGFANQAALSAALSDNGVDTTLDLGAGNQVVMQNVTVAGLDLSTDFII